LEQAGHFEEIWIWLKHVHEQTFTTERAALRSEVERFMREAEREQHDSGQTVGEEGEPLEDPAGRFESTSEKSFIERPEEDAEH